MSRPEHIENAFTSCCMLHNILLESNGYLDCESSDTQHIAHTVRGDCMELHVTSHRNFLNETVAGGKQSQWWNRVQLLVDHYDEFRKRCNKKQVSKIA